MRLKRTFYLILGLLFISNILLAVDFPKPTPYKYINDYVGVVEPEYVQKIISVGKELEDKTTAQVTAVIIDSLQGITIEEYAVELFRRWGIGQKGKDNGVLLLVAINDRQMRIEVGYGLEGAIPDGKAGRIRDEYIIPYFKEGDYSKGIYYGYLALAKEVAKEYNVELTFDVDAELPKSSSAYVETIVIVLIVVFIMLVLSRRGVWYIGPRGPMGPGNFGGFGGFRGSGRSSGGGFGGFGGGRSGGGGASGKW
ncbi:methanol dehydrogenase [Fervidobacterium sp. SC_NGM5_O18]|uniref:Methanol dehydrogenase n=1 Tax=Fervidobacterium pennivorans TaxID=93466 RepID=A0A172T3Q2_FERPE|nr:MULTISPECIES: TPM domain-containing protein [Fervidobacterium]ANE41649.1 methanol dehydrogenase [Fervidobacterium pennivorans]MDM7320579.1 TPM domain-containing protein [Fervidobacterium sp.]NPU89437.1 YgcG family protein [Fervidobacterium sp.]PHJ13453.1 methanol dehydrogenase [Fervidobacterium sp. SC_NGM5_O18]